MHVYAIDIFVQMLEVSNERENQTGFAAYVHYLHNTFDLALTTALDRR